MNKLHGRMGRLAILAVIAAAVTACSQATQGSIVRPSSAPVATATPKPIPATPAPLPTEQPATVIAAAGDIGCPPDLAKTSQQCHADATAALIEQMHPAAVLTLGDLQYGYASKQDDHGGLTNPQSGPLSYSQTWGQLKAIPVLGNHDDASEFSKYFGTAPVPPGWSLPGWYSFDLGGWHIIALNSEACIPPAGNCASGSDESRWLQTDLAAHPAACTLAFWHHPLFTSGSVHKPEQSVWPLWQLLAQAKADVVLNGHQHQYERFAPLNTNGQRDDTGLTEFVVGTGGRSLYAFNASPDPASQVRYPVFGVLKLTLSPGSYRWDFLNESGQSIDNGEASCH